MPDSLAIEAQELTKKFGDFTAVDRITFTVKKGEIFGFLGANGAGKTTAIRMLTGLLRPTPGQAWVAGYDIYHDTEKIKHNIGYLSQRFSLYNDLTVWENMELFGGIYGMRASEIKQKADEVIEKLGIGRLKNRQVKHLPLGFKQKLAFSVAIFHEPQIVFLDEPTGGVDPIVRRQFWEMIYEEAERGITAFVTTHYMDEAEYCNRLSIMVDGQIQALGTPGELKQKLNSKNMDEVFLKLARQQP